MGMVVKNNLSAINSLNTLNKNESTLQKSLQKVSSGMRINSAKDDASGKGGGSLGVRRGHLPAVVALEEGGTLRVTRGGETVYSARVQNGFARISREEVTVLTPKAEELPRNGG